ncbi:ApbE family lipoprotein [Acidimicrobium ferrooxidans DSM 10331]|uniref:FAD:protein FMN transferase n=1 Tax=Acidimicrobium ferrooxidans (strain DSM 10331 / JCM 15462 / NBRC 103882 / ICP) TaxID=525909 RepID=C7LZS1_ACIFD|nr:FAD:protein FMN transferase [Acidimicrobium ferrooxidans]ACU54229.1 ApbE family lipoprotein [Acidimicrobium ferrooxidans DSM 10331]
MSQVTFEAMGTVVSVAIEGVEDGSAESRCERLVARVEALERSLSAWRDDSALLRRRRGEVVDDPALREVEALAEVLRVLTHGAFDPHGPLGLDLDGVAKGWIVERAALEAFADLAPGARVSVAAGGDVWLRGDHRVGVAHPQVRGALVAVLRVEDGGVATSGTLERGDHVRAPGGQLALSQATVCAPTLWLADGLATALLVAGEALAAALSAIPGVGWYVVTRGGERRWGGAIEVLASA